MATILEQLQAAHAAQQQWAEVWLPQRLAILQRARFAIAQQSSALVDAFGPRPGRSRGESLNAEVLPLLDAIKFLEEEAEKILAHVRLGKQGRPSWLMGHHAVTARAPLGIILVIGPGNYPLFLTGVHAVQALTAGNAVIVKPGINGSSVILALKKFLVAAGLPENLMIVLDESAESAQAAWSVKAANGTPLVKKVVLTGSANSGAAILKELAPTLIPSTMELSGCDAAFVLSSADLDLTAKAIAWGLRLNAGCTCIAPRRIFAHASVVKGLEQKLGEQLSAAPAIPVVSSTLQKLKPWVDVALKQGARMLQPVEIDPAKGEMKTLVLLDAKPEMEIARADVFAPVTSVITFTDDLAALQNMHEQCPYALGASIFGEYSVAAELAGKLRTGSVAINDLIAPTADPRTSFGGVDRSGFGSTRGAEGLLEMTYPKVVTYRKGTFRPHFDPAHPDDERLFTEYIKAAHGPDFFERVRSWMNVLSALRKRK